MAEFDVNEDLLLAAALRYEDSQNSERPRMGNWQLGTT